MAKKKIEYLADLLKTRDNLTSYAYKLAKMIAKEEGMVTKPLPIYHFTAMRGFTQQETEFLIYCDIDGLRQMYFNLASL